MQMTREEKHRKEAVWMVTSRAQKRKEGKAVKKSQRAEDERRRVLAERRLVLSKEPLLFFFPVLCVRACVYAQLRKEKEAERKKTKKEKKRSTVR